MAGRVGQQFGNYRLMSLLGRGGFAEVYLAEHIQLGMKAAIKILHAHLASEEISVFLQEARTIAELKHPHIIRVLDFDIQNGTPFLVLDYASEGSLRAIHPRGSKLPLDLVVTYVKPIASALQYAHEHKLVHRDVKPENMLVGQHKEVLLSDFGIVAIAHSTSSMSAQPSMGTIPYMAPEQIQSYPRPASDQYALGIVVYQWLTGSLPFQGSIPEVIAKHLSVPPPPLRATVPDLPLAVEQMVLTALAKDPKERFGNVQAFANALEQASLSKGISSFSQSNPLSPPAPHGLAPTTLASASQGVASETPSRTALTTPAGITSSAQIALSADQPVLPFPQRELPEKKRSASKIAFQQGLIFGGALIVVGDPLGWGLSILFPGAGLLLVMALVFFLAGMRTAFLTSKVSTGIVASLWVALWQFFAFLILFLILALFGIVIAQIHGIDLILFLLSSVGLGALGAWSGRSMGKRSRQKPPA